MEEKKRIIILDQLMEKKLNIERRNEVMQRNTERVE